MDHVACVYIHVSVRGKVLVLAASLIFISLAAFNSIPAYRGQTCLPLPQCRLYNAGTVRSTVAYLFGQQKDKVHRVTAETPVVRHSGESSPDSDNGPPSQLIANENNDARVHKVVANNGVKISSRDEEANESSRDDLLLPENVSSLIHWILHITVYRCETAIIRFRTVRDREPVVSVKERKRDWSNEF